jgi:hypothetical protein
VHSTLRIGLPEGDDVPWYTVRFAELPDTACRQSLARTFEQEIARHPSLMRDTEGAWPWRWSDAMAIVPLRPSDPDTHWEEPRAYGAFLSASQELLEALHRVAPIAEAWESDEPSGGEPDAAFELTRHAAREELLIAAPTLPRAKKRAPRGRKGSEPDEATEPVAFVEDPAVPDPPLRELPGAITSQYREVTAAARCASGWLVRGIEREPEWRWTIALHEAGAARVRHFDLPSPQSIRDAFDVSASRTRALCVDAFRVYELDIASGAVSVVFEPHEDMTGCQAAAYLESGRLAVLTNRDLRILDAEKKPVTRVRIPSGEALVAAAPHVLVVCSGVGGEAGRVYEVGADEVRLVSRLRWVGQAYAAGNRMHSLGRQAKWTLKGLGS